MCAKQQTITLTGSIFDYPLRFYADSCTDVFIFRQTNGYDKTGCRTVFWSLFSAVLPLPLSINGWHEAWYKINDGLQKRG